MSGKIRLKYLVVPLLMAVAGCAADPARLARSVGRPLTLTSDARLPAVELREFYSPTLWGRIRDEQFTGFVIVEADVSENRLLVRRLVESFPDGSRNQLALRLLQGVELKVSTIGTNLPPRAVAYVVFYEKNLDGDLALIYAKQTDYSVPGEQGRARYFDAHRL